MNDLSAFQRDLMYIIAGLDKPAGLEVKDELDPYYDTEIHHGRLYPNLDKLVEMGLVQKTTRNRRTNEYILTSRGKREIQHRRDWEDQYITER